MTIQRPLHLVGRQINGRAFSEPVTILRVAATRNEQGRTETVETPIETFCATAPASSSPRARELTQAGARIDSMRMFWTVENIETVPGDILVYENERYRAESTERWGGFSETMGVRQEGRT